MGKKLDIGRSSVVFAGLIVLVVGLVIANSLQRTTYVTLPTDTTDTEQTTTADSADAINTVTVTTDTVQEIIASLIRSDYRRTLRIEQLWSEGSGSRDITVTQVGGFQRIDQALADGRVQHILSTPEALYSWFEEDTTFYQSPVGGFTVYQLQGIPTYEDVLDLPTSAIADAAYESLSGVRCIFVETATDSDGYVSRYWISVDSGLLVAAERLEEGETIYRMAVVSEEAVDADGAYFVLPNGVDITAEV